MRINKPASKAPRTLKVGANASPKSDGDWEVQDAMRTLIRAEEIKRDPGLMAKVKVAARRETTKLTTLTGRLKRGKSND